MSELSPNKFGPGSRILLAIASLEKDPPATSSRVRQWMIDNLGEDINSGSLYTCMKKLEKQKLIEMYKLIVETRRRGRLPYGLKVTEAGRGVLSDQEEKCLNLLLLHRTLPR